MLLLRLRYLLNVSLFLALFLVGGCSKFDRPSADQPPKPQTLADKIRGYWLATEVTRNDGSRVRFDNVEESFLFSINHNFLFYLLDGSLPECSDVEQSYLLLGQTISVSPVGRCKARTADVVSVTPGTGEVRNVVLRNVNFGNTLVYRELRLRSIPFTRFSHLLETVFKPNKLRYMEGRTPVGQHLSSFLLRELTAYDVTLHENLDGFWLLESLDYAGQTHLPGETFRVNKTTLATFQKNNTLLQFGDGKMNIYRNENVALDRNVEYEIRDSRLYALRILEDLEMKHQILEIKMLDIFHRELRTGNLFNASPVELGERDAIVFRRVSFAEARAAMGLNSTFKRLNNAD